MEVDTVATDTHGKPVTDLRADEFRIFEDDHAQELAHFSFESVEKLDPRATERVRALAQNKSKAVYTNFAEDVSQVPLNGCTLLLVDWLNTPLELQPQAQEQLKEFVKTADLEKPLAIYALDRSLHLVQDFTTNRTVLLSKIEKSGIHTANLQPEKRARSIFGLDPDGLACATNSSGADGTGPACARVARTQEPDLAFGFVPCRDVSYQPYRAYPCHGEFLWRLSLRGAA